MRALSFGAVAERYERYRPGYPEELADLVLGFAGRPIGSALEIGAGTGKATRLFAARGIAVTATDPDQAMLDELRKHVGVRTIRAAFEEVPTGERYDLVYAAAALHWTRPDGRWDRVAALLKAGGAFASFGGPVRLVDPAVERAVSEARAPFLDTDEFPSPDGTPPEREMQWPGTELLQDARFTDVRQVTIPQRLTVSASAFVGLLSTISAYLQLPEPERAWEAISRVLPETVEIEGGVVAHLARRT
ncbi:class I SAM-dependent methyltransferase [Catenuloplanes japonicus]|uniref:class I SAM-dependent methyltransferase n=1 Tax=Catenuloplanes japonicus TaxID=33876 RepID=UPI0005271716|nr:class I SAM-dependent methyltransferase [Catenuloplanes japonicus]